MRLILIRHGQTLSNTGNFLDTAVPGPGLTELGERQAQALPAAFAGQDIAALYVSNLVRTQQTAVPFALDRGLDAAIEPGLREISAGNLEMKNDMPSLHTYLTTVKSWLGGDLDVRMPGGDTGAEVLERFDDVVRRAEAQAGGGTVAIVSHGAMIRVWSACRAKNVDWNDPSSYELSNTGFVVMDGTMDSAHPGGAWKIERWQAQPAGGATVMA